MIREPRFLDTLRQANDLREPITSTQGITSRLVHELHMDLEETVLALMAGGLPLSNIEIRIEPSIIIENQMSSRAHIIITTLEDRAPENYPLKR